jgi:hypothetical protein
LGLPAEHSTAQLPELTVYPNPATDGRVTFRLVSATEREHFTAQLITPLGQVMREFDLVTNTETTLHHLPSGTYYVIVWVQRPGHPRMGLNRTIVIQ